MTWDKGKSMNSTNKSEPLRIKAHDHFTVEEILKIKFILKIFKGKIVGLNPK